MEVNCEHCGKATDPDTSVCRSCHHRIERLVDLMSSGRAEYHSVCCDARPIPESLALDFQTMQPHPIYMYGYGFVVIGRCSECQDGSGFQVSETDRECACRVITVPNGDEKGMKELDIKSDCPIHADSDAWSNPDTGALG